MFSSAKKWILLAINNKTYSSVGCCFVWRLLTYKIVKLRGSSAPESKMKGKWGCHQPWQWLTVPTAECHLHALARLSCLSSASRTVCSHSLTQFCQNDLVNLNASNSKVFLKPNHFDRAGLGHCSCCNSSKSNFHLRGSYPPSAPTTCKLHIPNNWSPFPFLLHCSLLSLQLCYLQSTL